MKRFPCFVSAVTALVGASCAATPLQPDAGGNGSLGGVGGSVVTDGGASRDNRTPIDTGIATDTGAATDGAWDASPILGRRSFWVASALSAADGGVVSTPSHGFTMVVDGDRLTAITGASGSGKVAPIQPFPGGFRIAAEIFFPQTPAPCSAIVTYDDLSFAFDSLGRLLGTGHGRLTTFVTSAADNVAVTMSLTALDDTLAPTLTLAPYGDLRDPFTPFSIWLSEPMPVQPSPVLRAAGGDIVVLSPSTPGKDFITAVARPSVLLRYGEQYWIDMSGMTDFAGNAAVSQDIGGLTFTTWAAPPLVAADGFESATGASLGGAQVLSAASDPIISGTRSLYIPAPSSGSGPATPFALRLAVPAGSTAMRFAYRTVNPSTYSSVAFTVASVGGSIVSATTNVESGGTTPATIGGAQAELGPLMTATIALPADATSEIVISRVSPTTYPCGGSVLVTPGIIIDELRVD